MAKRKSRELKPLPIRLACNHCDRQDCDFIEAIPAGWEDVEELSLSDLWLRTDGEWWTHMGTCPECWGDVMPVEPVAECEQKQRELFE